MTRPTILRSLNLRLGDGEYRMKPVSTARVLGAAFLLLGASSAQAATFKYTATGVFDGGYFNQYISYGQQFTLSWTVDTTPGPYSGWMHEKTFFGAIDELSFSTTNTTYAPFYTISATSTTPGLYNIYVRNSAPPYSYVNGDHYGVYPQSSPSFQTTVSWGAPVPPPPHPPSFVQYIDFALYDPYGTALPYEFANPYPGPNPPPWPPLPPYFLLPTEFDLSAFEQTYFYLATSYFSSYGHFTSLSISEVIATETPLPAALPLFAAGLGVVAFVSRRKKQKSLVAA